MPAGVPPPRVEDVTAVLPPRSCATAPRVPPPDSWLWVDEAAAHIPLWHPGRGPGLADQLGALAVAVAERVLEGVVAAEPVTIDGAGEVGSPVAVEVRVLRATAALALVVVDCTDGAGRPAGTVHVFLQLDRTKRCTSSRRWTAAGGS